MILNIYCAGVIIVLLYYGSGHGQRLYNEIKEKSPNADPRAVRASVRTTIIIYCLLWFISLPFIIKRHLK